MKKIKKQRKEFFSNYRNLKGCKNPASSFLDPEMEEDLASKSQIRKQLILKCQCFLNPGQCGNLDVKS